MAPAESKLYHPLVHWKWSGCPTRHSAQCYSWSITARDRCLLERLGAGPGKRGDCRSPARGGVHFSARAAYEFGE
jgi:hypothetical protein